MTVLITVTQIVIIIIIIILTRCSTLVGLRVDVNNYNYLIANVRNHFSAILIQEHAISSRNYSMLQECMLTFRIILIHNHTYDCSCARGHNFDRTRT